MVKYLDMAREQRAVAQDDAVTNDAVVRHVGRGHDQRPRADAGHPRVLRAGPRLTVTCSRTHCRPHSSSRVGSPE